MSTITELDIVPLSAGVGDKWVDLFNDRLAYVCRTAYANEISQLVVPATDRPGAVALTFDAIAVGGNGDLIDVAILNAGASGTSALVKTGLGATSDRFLYTFNVYDNDSSNNALISLLSGDPDLVASGADATDATFSELTIGSLTGAVKYFDPMNIHIDYVAELPDIVDTTKDISFSIPIDIRNSLSEKLASAMMIQDEGGDRNTMAMYEGKSEVAEQRASRHRSQGTAPSDVQPG